MTTEQMENRIRSAFPGSEVAVIDSTGTADHFDVRIAAKQFVGMSRIQQHKAVMALFHAELKTGEVHALELKTIEVK